MDDTLRTPRWIPYISHSSSLWKRQASSSTTPSETRGPKRISSCWPAFLEMGPFKRWMMGACNHMQSGCQKTRTFNYHNLKNAVVLLYVQNTKATGWIILAASVCVCVVVPVCTCAQTCLAATTALFQWKSSAAVAWLSSPELAAIKKHRVFQKLRQPTAMTERLSKLQFISDTVITDRFLFRHVKVTEWWLWL